MRKLKLPRKVSTLLITFSDGGSAPIASVNIQDCK